MHDPTLEDSNERDRIAGSWSSPVYPLVFFLVAMPLEWWLWKDAPFMQLGWQVVLGLSIVVAAVPWKLNRSVLLPDCSVTGTKVFSETGFAEAMSSRRNANSPVRPPLAETVRV